MVIYHLLDSLETQVPIRFPKYRRPLVAGTANGREELMRLLPSGGPLHGWCSTKIGFTEYSALVARAHFRWPSCRPEVGESIAPLRLIQIQSYEYVGWLIALCHYQPFTSFVGLSYKEPVMRMQQAGVTMAASVL